MLKAVTALIIMVLTAVLILKYFKSIKPHSVLTCNKFLVLSSLRLSGRDIFYVVRCGPEVIAFVLSSGGATVMGRWKYEEFMQDTDNFSAD